MPLDLARPGSLVGRIELEAQMLAVSPDPRGYAGQVEQGLRASALERRQGRDIEAELLFGEVQEALVLGGEFAEGRKSRTASHDASSRPCRATPSRDERQDRKRATGSRAALTGQGAAPAARRPPTHSPRREAATVRTCRARRRGSSGPRCPTHGPGASAWRSCAPTAAGPCAAGGRPLTRAAGLS